MGATLAGNFASRKRADVVTELRPSRMTAEVKARSTNEAGEELITAVVTIARPALAELNTHRAMSRNSASSRAIPAHKMLAAVRANPYIPRAFGLKGKGMAPSRLVEYGTDEWAELAQWWVLSMERAMASVEMGLSLGVHKQDVNRILEPFMMHTVVVSATEWENFFRQRTEIDSETGKPVAYLPIYDAALALQEAIASAPAATLRPTTGPDSWHLPLLQDGERDDLPFETARMVSVARSARVSYFSDDGAVHLEDNGKTVEEELALADRLLRSMKGQTPHASPFEHVAQAAPGARSGNFLGWRQFREQVVEQGR